MRIKQHKESGLWVTDDGRVIQPPCRKYPKFRFTFGCEHPSGYMMVVYRGKQYQVHRLVAETFIPNPNGYPTVDHINRVKTANFAPNLRWASMKMQANNTQMCEDSLEKYGVRHSEDPAGYWRARYAAHCEQAKARSKAYRESHREEIKARRKRT